jgi:hypothetical protein
MVGFVALRLNPEMGYNLHITRRKHWSDEGDESISLNEWHSYVESDSELRMDDSLGEHFVVWSGPSTLNVPWLAWANGNIETKNPDQPLIRKMVAISSALGANVQGDDGERYDRSGAPEPFPSLGFFERVKHFWSRVTARPLTPLDPSELPFKVGDRVRDVFGNEATITVIDVRAEQGAGAITVKYDDGRTAQSMALAHGFERVNP